MASLLPYILNESEQTSRVRFDLLSLVDPGFMTRVGVHYGLFFGAIRGQATMEQMSDLIQKGLLNLRGMYGCFAMTELGYVVPCRARFGPVRAVVLMRAAPHTSVGAPGTAPATAPTCRASRRRRRLTRLRTSSSSTRRR